MFDPLFALSLLTVIAISLALGTFLVAKRFLPVASARLMAFILPVIALIGFFGTARAQASLNPYFFDEAPLMRLAISLVGSALLAGMVGWLIYRLAQLNRPI